MLTEVDDRNNYFNSKNNGIPHFSHEHDLNLYPFEDNKNCNGCMRSISTQSYGCPPCGFYLHEECVRLPKQHKNSLLHSHELSMIYIPDFVFSCAECLQSCHGFAYYCEKCHYTIDIRCVVLLALPYTHPSHHHPLSYFHIEVDYYKDWYGHLDCRACRGSLENRKIFGCKNCKFYLDLRCACLPLAIRNRFDEHPLSLTCVNNNKYKGHEYFKDEDYRLEASTSDDEEEGHDEYYCDICEERQMYQWFYSCELCCFAAHINCVLGKYPFLKSAQFEGHQHPLSWVKVGTKGYSTCSACGDSCEGNLAFECGRFTCKFNVHAFGKCYSHQLSQGRITFTMPSLRHRSIPLYLDPIQRKRSKFILLGRSEGRGRSAWNERVFTVIRQFLVNHKRWADSIRIQYEENEKSFCTKHGQDGSKKHENVGRRVVISLGQHVAYAGVNVWDDGVFSSIKQVVITHNGEYIHSIWTQYCDDDGNLTRPVTRGERAPGDIDDPVELQPEEYLISINGCITANGLTRLTLESNKKIYGPFGKGPEEVRFLFPLGVAKIVGFHGTTWYYLRSIGVKLVPI